jgi:hypothetical protein
LGLVFSNRSEGGVSPEDGSIFSSRNNVCSVQYQTMDEV